MSSSVRPEDRFFFSKAHLVEKGGGAAGIVYFIMAEGTGPTFLQSNESCIGRARLCPSFASLASIVDRFRNTKASADEKFSVFECVLEEGANVGRYQPEES